MKHHGRAIKRQRQLVIASCGGSPRDINLIQSHKTIQYSTRALTKGGTLLLLAECPENFGTPAFADYFPIEDTSVLLEDIRLNNPPNGQTALALHQKTREFNIGMVTAMRAEDVKKIGIEPFGSIDEARVWLEKKGFERKTGYIIADGSTTLPLPE